MFYKLTILLLVLLSSCSKYTIEDGGEGNIPIDLKLNNVSADDNNTIYPICVYCINQKDLSAINLDFDNEEPLTIKLPEGEYSINVFCGLNKDGFSFEKDFSQTPVLKINNGGHSPCPLRAAHTTIDIKKATEVNLIPTYIVSSVEFELEDIPEEVTGVNVTLSPIYKSYAINGKGYNEESATTMECAKTDNRWCSGVKYIFPSSTDNTKITIKLVYGDKAKSYSYTLKKAFTCGTPYKFTGRYDGNGGSTGNDGGSNNGEMDLDGDFCISGWDMKEEISFDISDGVIDEGGNDEGNNDEGNNEPEDIDIETFYVNELPSRFDIFGPLFVWKSDVIKQGEAIVTVIAPMQWPEILAKDAIPTIEAYSVDEITGWRMFTREEAKEFYTDFDGGNSEINDILYDNGHNIFYSQDINNKGKRARYLCDNARATFSLYGSFGIIKAGEKTKYYLRPVKTMRLVVKSPIE